MEYLISDMHYFHKNILNFESNTRGHFNSVDEMNEELTLQWNSVVSPDDIVYCLGDISINKKYEYLVTVLSRLNGKIIVIQGNHDNTDDMKKLLRDGHIEELHPVGIRLKRRKQTMWLTHYPMEIGARKNKWSIHGHIHSEPSQYENQINVGVDSSFMLDTMGLQFGQPVALDAVVEYMVNNPVEPIRREED